MKKEDQTNLEHKVVIITGGCGMLGLEYAKALSSHGAIVCLLDILAQDAIDKILEKFKKEHGREIFGISVDVTDEKQIKKAIEKIFNKHKRIDILINNASLTDFSGSIDRFAPFEEFSLDVWRKEVEVGLTGAFITAKAVIPYMKEKQSGIIVNISSIYGICGADNRIYEKGRFRSPAYSASKSGLINLTRALASYLAPFDIRVNTLTLGGVFADNDKRFVKEYSKRTMLARMAQKQEVHGPIVFLCSDASSYMTGANLIVDGGWSAW